MIRDQRYPVQVLTRYFCCVPGCGVYHEESQDVTLGSELMPIFSWPSIPGWRIWVGGLYCPAHKVKMEIDGETLDL